MRRAKNRSLGVARTLLAASAAVLLAFPASSAEKSIKTMTDAELAEKVSALKEISDADPSQICPAVPYVEELARRDSTPIKRGAALLSKGLCDLMANRPAAALAAFEKAEGYLTSKSDTPFPEMEMLSIYAASYSGNWEKFADHAVHAARRNLRSEFAGLDNQQFRQARYFGSLVDAERWAVAFARSENFDALHPTLQSVVAETAMGPALRTRDTALAGQSIARLNDPSRLFRLLVNRDYIAVWPELEARAGSGFGPITREFVAAQEARVAEAPEDTDRQADLAQALFYLHRDAEVIAMARKLDTGDGYATIDEHQGWMLNTAVDALDAIGAKAEADAVFDSLARLDPEIDGRIWLGNFVINRAARLTRQGRWAEALAAAEQAVGFAGRSGSPYAKQISAVYRFCARAKLAPASNLDAQWAELDAARGDAPVATAQAAICRDDTASARRIVVEAMAVPENRVDMLSALQPRAAGFRLSPKTSMPQLHDLLLGDPTLMKEFERYGRVLPKAMWPSAGQI